jgi:cupin domain
MGMFTLLGSPKKKAMIVEPAEGSSFKDLGVELLFKTTAEHSAGNLSVFHYKAPPLFVGPPAHYHKKMHEGFYCLEGTVGIETDGQTAELRAGAYAFRATDGDAPILESDVAAGKVFVDRDAGRTGALFSRVAGKVERVSGVATEGYA